MSVKFEETCRSLDRDDRFRATVYAMNTLAIKKGLYSRDESEGGFIEWVEREQRKPIVDRERPQFILERVAQHFGMEVSDLRIKRNFHTLVLPRWVAWHLLREVCLWSTSQIGSYFGGFHHTTVMHGLRTFKTRMEADAGLRNLVEQIKSELVAQ